MAPTTKPSEAGLETLIAEACLDEQIFAMLKGQSLRPPSGSVDAGK